MSIEARRSYRRQLDIWSNRRPVSPLMEKEVLAMTAPQSEYRVHEESNCTALDDGPSNHILTHRIILPSWLHAGARFDSNDPTSSFVEGLGAGQIVSRQALASPYLGDIQLSLSDRKGNLEVEVIRARRLQSKPGSKTLPCKFSPVVTSVCINRSSYSNLMIFAFRSALC